MDRLTDSIMARVAGEPDPTPARAFAVAARRRAGRDALASAATGWRVAMMRDRRVSTGSRIRGLALALGVTGALVVSSSVVLGAAAVGAVTVVRQIAEAGGMDVLPDRGSAAPVSSPSPSAAPSVPAASPAPSADASPAPVLVVLPPDDDYDLDPSVPRDTSAADNPADGVNDEGDGAADASAQPDDGEPASGGSGDGASSGDGEQGDGGGSSGGDDATATPRPTTGPGDEDTPASEDGVPNVDTGDAHQAPGTDPENDLGD